MVMAGIEGVSGPATTDESLSGRLQWLRQRREVLEDKLAQKNSELKSLCIEEAELTGVLPPEIPLEPGESPPCIRKRTSTAATYSHNLINKLKTNRVEESSLEVERQVQINLAETALAVLNDPSESKAVRRKQRAIYQQSQRRLQELNAQLNFIRQSHGGGSRSLSAHIPLHSSQPHLQNATKHRTKKPRPPLENQGKDLSPMMESRGLLQEGGISLSPLGPEYNYNTHTNYDLQDFAGVHSYGQPGGSLPHNRATYHAPSPVEQHNKQRLVGKFVDQELINNNVVVNSDQFRSRAYSQGGNSSGGSSISPHNFSTHERPCRYLPNTYTEEERQMHYRQMKIRRQEAHEEMLKNQQYSESKYLDNVDAHRRSAQITYHETDPNSPRFETQPHDYPVYFNRAKSQSSGILRPRDSVDNVMQGPEYKTGKPAVDTYIPPGHWMRLDDEIIWCSDDQMSDRFGSLDRRKQTVPHHYQHHQQLTPGIETQSRYHTVTLGGKNIPMLHARQPPYPNPPPVQSPDGSIKLTPPSSRMLLRTQSLGSVEGWQQQQSPMAGTNSSQDAASSTTSAEDRESADDASSRFSLRSLKEKEWYETSLDGTGLPPPQRPIVRRGSQHNPQQPPPPPLPPPPPPPPAKDRMPVRSNSIPSNRRTREHLPVAQQLPGPPVPQSRYKESRVLEIPAESKLSPGSQENGNEPIISLNTLTNHTIVQPGKYQPYREETKPFEMSDFYKYSTKFRNKKIEANATNEQQQQMSPNVNMRNDQNQINISLQRTPQPVQTVQQNTLR